MHISHHFTSFQARKGVLQSTSWFSTTNLPKDWWATTCFFYLLNYWIRMLSMRITVLKETIQTWLSTLMSPKNCFVNARSLIVTVRVMWPITCATAHCPTKGPYTRLRPSRCRPIFTSSSWVNFLSGLKCGLKKGIRLELTFCS
jgi:hypothetical protein